MDCTFQNKCLARNKATNKKNNCFTEKKITTTRYICMLYTKYIIQPINKKGVNTCLWNILARD